MPKLSEVTASKPKKLSEVTAAPAKGPNALGFRNRSEGELYGMGPAYAIADGLDAAQHHIGNAILGTGQLIHKGVTAGANLLPEGNPVRRKASGIDRRAPAKLAQREADYQARVPTNAASVTGAAVGEVLPWMVGVGELRAAGMLPKIVGPNTLANLSKKGGLLAAEGAAMGAAQPVMGEGGYAGQKAAQVGTGAVLAPATGGTLAALGGAGRLSRYLTPGGRSAIADERLAGLYGAEPATLDRLRQGTGVPGFQLTPAQALATPEAVQTERMLRNNGATAPAFAEREAANNAAARGQVARVAGDDGALEAARTARRGNADAFRKQNLPEQGSPMVDATPVFNKLEVLSLSANPVIRGAAREHLALLKRQAVDGKVPAFALDDVRQNAGAMIAKHTPVGGGSSKEAAKYGPVTDQIADTLDGAIPGYRNYLATYARDSQPVNDMEAGRALLSAIDSGGRDASGNQAVNLSQVKSLLSKDNRANFPMSESARREIEAVLDALQQRSVTNNTIAAAGPGTAADLMRGLSPAALRWFSHAASIVGGVKLGPLGYLAGAAATEGANAANNAVLRLLGQKSASANTAADALEAHMLRGQGRGSSALDYLLPYETRALPPPRR